MRLNTHNSLQRLPRRCLSFCKRTVRPPRWRVLSRHRPASWPQVRTQPDRKWLRKWQRRWAHPCDPTCRLRLSPTCPCSSRQQLGAGAASWARLCSSPGGTGGRVGSCLSKRLRSNRGRSAPARLMRRGAESQSFNAASRPHLSAAAADEILV